MSKLVNHVGIDVSASELVVKLQLGKEKTLTEGVFANDLAGHKKLLKFITKQGHHARVCLEATGVYHIGLAVMLANSDKVSVMIVNPKAMKHFSTALLKRAKTDRVDAQNILEYLLRMDFVEWQLPSDVALEIQTLSHRLFQLKQEIGREDSRSHAISFKGKAGKIVARSIKKNKAHMKKNIAEIEACLVELIQSDEVLKKSYDLLVSVKGIAQVSAIQILSEIILLPADMSASQWVAYAGLDPKPVESGSSINKPRHISRQGNKFLRAALYMPAWVAVRHDEHVGAYYDKLVGKGKKQMQAIVAVMRKLLRCIWGILHSQTSWQGEKFYKIM